MSVEERVGGHQSETGLTAQESLLSYRRRLVEQPSNEQALRFGNETTEPFYAVGPARGPVSGSVGLLRGPRK